MKNINPILIVIAIVVPLFCVGVILIGVLGVGFIFASAEDGLTASAAVNPEEAESQILVIATEYGNTGDLEMARQKLNELELPNPEQYVSFMVDRRQQEGKGQEDTETMSLFALADALGTSTASMVAALSTPTPLPTPTLPPPTETPVPPTETPVPTAMPIEEVVAETVENEGEEGTVEAEAAVAEAAPTDIPIPTDTPVPVDTPTPAPPTDTPEPPKPAVDFAVTQAHMIPNPTYNSCPGSHQIFVTVVDAAGNALDGVTVEDTFRVVPPKTSGEKGPGKLEYDLWNNGFSLEVTKNNDGSPVTSDVTPKMSSWDEDIPNEWLIEANYCLDMNDCLQRKGSNQLCRGHYSYNVTFQRTY